MAEPPDSFDRAALFLLDEAEFDAEGLRRTWDEIYRRMLIIEAERASRPPPAKAYSFSGGESL